MKNFLDWFNSKGFWIRDAYDPIDGFQKEEKMKLFPFQERILSHAFTLNPETNKFPYTTVVYSTIKKSGKPLALSTIVPTPDGYRTMGDIRVGDYVFDVEGNPVRVKYVTDVMYGRRCYEIEFANGERVIASSDHDWEVLDQFHHTPSIKTTEELAGEVEGLCGGYTNRVAVSAGIAGGNSGLPFDPYLIGVWLGDGSSTSTRITSGDADIEELVSLLRDRGIDARIKRHKNRPPSVLFGDKVGGDISTRTHTFGYFLRKWKLRDNKHIPISYLRATRHDRLELLRGLMDSDGYISEKGRCEFTSTNKNLAEDVWELLASLGIKSKVITGQATLYGRVIGTKYRIHFTAHNDIPVFNLTRKRERQVDSPDRKARSKTNSIVAVEEVDSVPVRCLMVDSDSHLFVVGRSFIPTHNTTIGAALTSWYLEEAPAFSEVYLIANDKEQTAMRAYGDVSYHLTKAGLAVPRKDKVEMLNGSIGYVLAQEYKSAAGGRQSFVLFDELWAYISEQSRRLWEEMTLPPTVQYPLKVIVTYAGFQGESDLLWDMYEDIVLRGEPVPELEDIVDNNGKPVCWRRGSRFAYWDSVPRLPWQTPEYYEEQTTELRPEQFLRLHRNEWVTAQSAFIPKKYWDRAEVLKSPLLYEKQSKWYRSPVSVGIDISVNGDRAAVVGVYFDTDRNKVCLAFNRIWHPGKGAGNELDPGEIEQYVFDMKKVLNISTVMYDPYQFHRSSIVMASKGLNMVRFDQTVQNTMAMSQNLFELFKTRGIEVYPEDELREHVIFAAAEDRGRGFRIVKDATSRRPVDGAVALAMACYDCVRKGGVDVSIPLIIRYPEGEISSLSDPSDTDWLPEALR